MCDICPFDQLPFLKKLPCTLIPRMAYLISHVRRQSLQETGIDTFRYFIATLPTPARFVHLHISVRTATFPRVPAALRLRGGGLLSLLAAGRRVGSGGGGRGAGGLALRRALLLGGSEREQGGGHAQSLRKRRSVDAGAGAGAHLAVPVVVLFEVDGRRARDLFRVDDGRFLVGFDARRQLHAAVVGEVKRVDVTGILAVILFFVFWNFYLFF